MNRREFLRASIILLSSQAIDPEELLWVPNKSRIFVPSMPRVPMSMSAIVALETERIMPHVRILFERDDTFYKELYKRKSVVSSREIRIPLIIKGE